MAKKPRPVLDPLRIYRLADSFSTAFDILSNRKTRAEALEVVRPSMAVSALATELFLKCLICLEGHEVPAWHNLKSLFDLLSEPRKQHIENLWDQCIAFRSPLLDQMDSETGYKMPRDLSYSLTKSALAFLDYRYYFEKGADEIQEMEFIISDLPIVLKLAIWEIKPDWKSAKDLHVISHAEAKQK